ncbi:MAG: hypothetical protein WBD36_16870 [Bacteroidota bacterium]
MKQLTLFFLVVILSTPALSQEQTVFDAENIEHGGYGAFVVGFTNVNNEFGVLVGGRGGWIINHTFAIGLGGYGIGNNVHSLVEGPLGQRFMNFGYGGLDLEFIVNSDDMVHWSIHTLLGGGSVGFRGERDDVRGFDMDMHDDEFFVAEPGINLDLNVISWFRASAGVRYRYISGVASEASTNGNLTGTSAVLTLRFGKF